MFFHRNEALVVLTTLALTMVSPSSAQATGVDHPRGSTSSHHSISRTLTTPFSAATLGSLTDYSALLDDNGVITKFRVHSPSDWEDFAAKPTPLSIQVSGSTFSLVPEIKGTTVTVAWTRIGPSQNYSAAVPYLGYARGFFALTHVAGTHLVHGSLCRQAGVMGRWWGFATADRGAIFPHVVACVATKRGWLLSYGTGTIASGGSPKGFQMDFEVTGVNNVGVISVPHGK